MAKAPWVVAMTGASGAIYGQRLCQALVKAQAPFLVVISDTAKEIIKGELGMDLHREGVAKLMGSRSGWQPCDVNDFTAPIASGSFRTSGMVIVPCSTGTLGAIANGYSQNLIHHATDVTLKEGRKLIIVPRETPLSAIHLENLLKLARLGVHVVPAMPGFYHRPKTIDELVNFVVGRVLDLMGIEHHLTKRWGGT